MKTQIPGIRGLPDTTLTMPEMAATSVDSLRLRGTLTKALPPMPAIKDLAMSPTKFIDAQERADDIRAAYSFSKDYDKRMRAVAKAKDYQATKAAERSGRAVNRHNSKQVRAQAMNSRRSYKQHAAQMGMDRSIFK